MMFYKVSSYSGFMGRYPPAMERLRGKKFEGDEYFFVTYVAFGTVLCCSYTISFNNLNRHAQYFFFFLSPNHV